LNKSQPQRIRNSSQAIFGQANWHFTDALTLTTGVRVTHEHRTNVKTSSLIFDNGLAPELNPSVVNGVVLGGFDSYFNSTTNPVYVLNGNVLTTAVGSTTPGATVVAPGAYALTTDATQPALVATANAQANAAAQKYFNVATWSALTNAQKKQLYYAQAIRKGQIGVLWNPTDAQEFNKTQPAWVISPSYKISDNITSYFSWQHGEKAGISQVINGNSLLVEPEKNNALELGLKTVLLDRTLVFNSDVFLMNITNFQQAVLVYDDYTTKLKSDGTLYYASATGSVPKVQVKGLEVDGTYTGIKHLTLRFSGAYNDAKYKEFPNSAQPVEYDTVATSTYTPAPYRDVSGQPVAGAAKVTFNVAAEYRTPIFHDREFHTAFNTAYSSRYKSDVSLSEYSWVTPNLVTDFDFGLGRRDGKFDVKIIAKNLFNDRTPQGRSWNTVTPNVGRWWGVQFSGKL
jgi:outer membrane receptor protein involved in Fe transport